MGGTAGFLAALMGAVEEDMAWLARRLPDYDISRMQTPQVRVLNRDYFADRQSDFQGRHERIQAIYNPRSNTISVSDEFTEMTPGLRALMAHEVAHAVQAANGARPPDREYEAYRVQQDHRRANGQPYKFPDDIAKTLADIDRRYGIERSPAQRGIYRDGEMRPELRQTGR